MSEHLHHPVSDVERMMGSLSLIAIAHGARVSALAFVPDSTPEKAQYVAENGGYGGEEGNVPENGYALLQNIEVMIQSLHALAAVAVDIAVFDGSLPEDLREELLPGEFVVGEEGIAYAHRSA